VAVEVAEDVRHDGDLQGSQINRVPHGRHLFRAEHYASDAALWDLGLQLPRDVEGAMVASAVALSPLPQGFQHRAQAFALGG
jgi:hypothetical protein